MNLSGLIRPLKTARFDLLKLEPEDANKMAALFADPEISKTLVEDWSNPDTRVEQARGWITEEANLVVWGIFDRERSFGQQHDCIGFIGVEEALPEVGRGPSIFYAFARHCWGAGVASEVVGAVLDHLFDTVGVEAVEALVYPGLNPASSRLLEKYGMRLVGHYPLAKYVGEYCLPTMRYEFWQLRNTTAENALECLRFASFKVGLYVGDGISDSAEMKSALLTAAQENSVFDRHGENRIRQVIDNAFEAGMQEPGWLYYRVERGERPN